VCDNYDLTSIRRAFDARSTAYRRSLGAQWRAANPLAAVSLTDLFTYLFAAVTQPGRNVGGWMVVSRRTTVESKSNRSCNHRRKRPTTAPLQKIVRIIRQIFLLIKSSR